MFDPRIIANEVLRRASQRGKTISNLHLQKIIYFLHGEWLALTGQPLVSGEFEAWQYGPVHRVLYDAFRDFGDAPIDSVARKFDPIRREFRPLPGLKEEAVRDFLDATLPRYIDVPPFILVQRTHAPGTPWSRTMEGAEVRANVGMVIENDLIAEHFEGGPRAEHSSPRGRSRKQVAG